MEQSEAVERLEPLERTDPHDERSVAVERFERLERVAVLISGKNETGELKGIFISIVRNTKAKSQNSKR